MTAVRSRRLFRCVALLADASQTIGYNRRIAMEAFDQLFGQFARSIIVLSYSSNGYPDLDALETLLRKHKKSIRVFEKPHRYHFGTHEKVERAAVTAYLIVGR